MTIDVTQVRERNNLILPNGAHFPGKIPQQHYQLKNFISTVDRGTIYYASRNQVYALHTHTRRRERIATLSLHPQCLGAGEGWIAVGGPEKGRCAFIRVGDTFSSPESLHSPAGHPVEADALLPLDLDPQSRVLAPNLLEDHGEDVRLPYLRAKVDYHELGGQIINSITVHKLRGGKEGLQDEVLAVIANNDETVRIFSLTQSRVLQTLEFPTAINHAAISPDGNLMLACGDQPRAFFLRKRRLSSRASNGESNFARHEWYQIADPVLTVAKSNDMCFSTAFSPSGHVCAVGSQGGTITIFDTKSVKENLEANDAVLETFKTSRPNLENGGFSGAVRSMAFGPEPWDLFAWAEDRGRVCVTDLRDHFTSRQTVELDGNGVDLVRLNIVDVDDEYSTAEQRELEIEARFTQRHREFLDAQDRLAVVNHAADYLELAAERRRLQHELRDVGNAVAYDVAGLTEGERRILDSLRMEPHRVVYRDLARQDSEERTFSIHHSRPRDTESPTTSSSVVPHNTSIRQYMRERNLERALDRARPPENRSYQPRRRSSVVISNSTSSNPSSSSHPSSLVPIVSTTSTFSASPSRLPSTSAATSPPRPSTNTPPPHLPILSSIDPWQTISAAMAASSAASAALDATARLRLERERDLESLRRMRERERELSDVSVAASVERSLQASARMERLRSTRLRQRDEGGDDTTYEDYEFEMLRPLAARGRGEDSANGVVTMGIGWSRDGNLLYVGTEEGIVELRVNIQERKTFPAVAFR